MIAFYLIPVAHVASVGHMKILSLLVTVLAVAALSGCGIKQKYQANQQAAQDWLTVNEGKAAINISGDWLARDGGWGQIRFVQNGSQVTGAMGSYSVKGVINGSRVSLALISSDWVYYTVKLKKVGDQLEGFYSSSTPFSEFDQAVVTLYKVSN